MTRQLRVAEPPAQYLRRPPLVVDCSVIAGALFREHWQDAAQQQIAGRELHAPYLMQAELAHVAVRKTRQGFAELASAGLRALTELQIDLHRLEEAAVHALALQYGLTAYDASYLWLAAELQAPLATFDAQLADAAQRHLSGIA